MGDIARLARGDATRSADLRWFQAAALLLLSHLVPALPHLLLPRHLNVTGGFSHTERWRQTCRWEDGHGCFIDVLEPRATVVERRIADRSVLRVEA